MTGRVLTGEAAAEIDDMEAFRGRAFNVQTTFANWRQGWDYWVDAPFWRNGLPELLAERGIRVSHSTPLLCKGSDGQFDECIRGDFDQYHRTVARRWKDLGHLTPIIRLGWETTQAGRAWGVQHDTSPGYQRYKDAFRRIADVYRHELPSCLIDWNNLRRPHVPVPEIYPGDDCVDIVSADLYGNRPAVETEEDWTSYANNKRAGGPAGPFPFLEFARSRGKRFAVPEWAVTNFDREPNGKFDSPVYIRGMWQFFQSCGSDLLYECYFNRRGSNGDHRVFPEEYNPRASAAYRELWSA